MEKTLELAKGIADYFGFAVLPLIAVLVAAAFFLLPAHIVSFAGWEQDDPDSRRWMSILFISGICMWVARFVGYLYRPMRRWFQKKSDDQRMKDVWKRLSADEKELFNKVRWIHVAAGGITKVTDKETVTAYRLISENLATGNLQMGFLRISQDGKLLHSWLRQQAGD